MMGQRVFVVSKLHHHTHLNRYKMNIFVINSHLNYPGWSEGQLNRTLCEYANKVFSQKGYQIAQTVIEEGYHPKEEVKKHLAADIVILQTPVNWFGAPWIHKKYVDEVFNEGLAQKTLLDGDGRTRSDPNRQYGTGGKMQGKKFMISATWNAPREAFDHADGVLYRGKGTADLFLNITSTYKFVGYDILPDFGVFDIYKSKVDMEAILKTYSTHLEKHCFEKLE